ncbi:UDP-4-amino-4,6-dideoxy-N-acetyl-beta-L-altrosamine N-acetyltransferase [Paenibacillus septentrionalis]|uniref:UDP-4-amino-4, 6-dideoxy-N-acetyl-beta-L-altrosamine N-acetyltransferase n=1 Tax=Paenibacillus septentrionalis TaxID=429342 RepID=A0ABW1V838_9BACL
MISFKQLCEKDLEQVLEWRTSEHVTQYMYTDIEKNIDKQREWFGKVSSDHTQFYWIIQYNNINIGLISLNQLDHHNMKATFGYYLGDLRYTMIAGRIHPYFYNFAFHQLGLHKLYAEVMDGNEGMMKMHLHYGFSHVATFKEHIYKGGRFHDVHYFELVASTWQELKKFHRFTANFAME